MNKNGNYPHHCPKCGGPSMRHLGQNYSCFDHRCGHKFGKDEGFKKNIEDRNCERK